MVNSHMRAAPKVMKHSHNRSGSNDLQRFNAYNGYNAYNAYSASMVNGQTPYSGYYGAYGAGLANYQGQSYP